MFISYLRDDSTITRQITPHIKILIRSIRKEINNLLILTQSLLDVGRRNASFYYNVTICQMTHN